MGRFNYNKILSCIVAASVLAGSLFLESQSVDEQLRLDSLTPVPELGLTSDSAVGLSSVWRAPMVLPQEASDTVPSEPDYSSLARQMGDFAANYLGARYRWGATGPKTFDCSGFTSHVFKNFGLPLNRTSRAQYAQGDKVDIKDVKPGDLLFFSGRKVSRRVGHVGMVVSVDPLTGSVEMIHASSSQGIARQKFPDNGYFSRRFLGARRYLGTDGFIPKS